MDNSQKYRMVLIIDSDIMELPVLPDKISIKRTLNSAEKTVLSLGNVNLIKGAKLRQITFSSFFPAVALPASVRAPKAPMDYVRKIKECMESEKPLRFVMLGTDLDINVQMSVESFEYTESYGAVGTLDYKLTLKEWVDYSPRRVVIRKDKATASSAARSGAPKSSPQSKGGSVNYTVKAGDCLWAICQAQYGDGSLYEKIYHLNRGVIDKQNRGTGNPRYTIYVGQVLTLPPKEKL